MSDALAFNVALMSYQKGYFIIMSQVVFRNDVLLWFDVLIFIPNDIFSFATNETVHSDFISYCIQASSEDMPEHLCCLTWSLHCSHTQSSGSDQQLDF